MRLPDEARPLAPRAPAPPGPPLEARPMIRVEGVRKTFGRREVLKGLHLEIPRGRITALVGPNASGKTTLIKILLGLVRPDGGKVEVGGHTLNGDWRYRERVGYMAQDAPLPENLSAGELFRMVGELRRGAGAQGASAPPGADAAAGGGEAWAGGGKATAGKGPGGGPAGEPDPELVEAFALAPELGKALRTLSGGTRQKVNAVLALLFDPDLLILDEPTAGLDPVASGILKDRILRERARGKTILITSHILQEVEELAEGVVFLLEGEVRFAGPTGELLARTGQERLERAVAELMRGGGGLPGAGAPSGEGALQLPGAGREAP